MFRSLLVRYDQLLTTHPLITKGLTTGFISGVGDVCTQLTFREKRHFQYDPVRTFNFAFLGFALVTPCLHRWYGFLSTKFPKTNVADTLKRTAADQFVFAPVFLSSFIASLALLEGRSETIFTQTTLQQWKETVVANWSLWSKFST